MDWIVTTGATVEEALENALDELSVTSDDVEYEILKEPKKILLGLRSSEAQIRTRVRPVAVPAKRERRRPARSEKRKKTKAQRPKPKSTSGNQKQQRRSSKRSQPKQLPQEPAQVSNIREAPETSSSTRKRTLTTEPKATEQSNTRSVSTKTTVQPPAKQTARRTRKIDH